jgi:hypothetical protein
MHVQVSVPPFGHTEGRYAALVAVADTEHECIVALDKAAAAVIIDGTRYPRSMPR